MVKLEIISTKLDFTILRRIFTQREFSQENFRRWPRLQKPTQDSSILFLNDKILEESSSKLKRRVTFETPNRWLWHHVHTAIEVTILHDSVRGYPTLPDHSRIIPHLATVAASVAFTAGRLSVQLTTVCSGSLNLAPSAMRNARVGSNASGLLGNWALDKSAVALSSGAANANVLARKSSGRLGR